MNPALTTDIQTDAVFSLQLVEELLEKIRQDDLYWKFVIIALHSSVQGFMVCAVTYTSRFSATFSFTEKDEENEKRAKDSGKEAITGKRKERKELTKKWLEWEKSRDAGKEPKTPKLAPFPELYDYIQSPRVMERLGGRAFHSNKRQDDKISRLNWWRNTLVHFHQEFWNINVQEFLPMVEDCMDIIWFLAFESGNILWLTAEHESKTKQFIQKIKGQIHSLEPEYVHF